MDETRQFLWGDECIGGEAIGFLFMLLHLRVHNLVREIFLGVVQNELVLSSVEEDMGDFVEKSEPDLVVSFIA
jgi:hypothetical protein